MKRKQVVTAGILIMVLFVSIRGARPVSFPPRPGEREFIYDEAGLISSKDEIEIKNMCAELLSGKSIPLLVVTIDSLSRYGAKKGAIDSYISDLFNEWANRDNKTYSWSYGILLLVSKKDKKFRIKLGDDWESEKERKSEEIMKNLIIPRFKVGDFSGGILLGVQALANISEGKSLPAVPRPAWHYPAAVGAILLLVFTVVSLSQSGTKGWAWIFWGGVFSALGFLLIVMITPSRRYRRRGLLGSALFGDDDDHYYGGTTGWW